MIRNDPKKIHEQPSRVTEKVLPNFINVRNEMGVVLVVVER